MEYFLYALIAVCCYFLGNISGGRIVSSFKHIDITNTGSGNPGTLNTWRACGFWPGVLTFVIDMIKGVVASLTAFLIAKPLGLNQEIALYVAGISVIIGHIFPIIFNFKGGKGIATSAGVFLVANWWVTLIVFVCMIVCMLFIKYASIFTVGFVIIMSIVEICLCSPANWINYILICGILALVIFAHRANIKRLLTGKENKTELLAMLKGLGKKKQSEEAK